MIQNLNRMSFAGYGTILEAAPAEEHARQMVETFQRDPVPEYSCFSGGPVYLERQYGMPVLIVSLDQCESTHRFYLDKPVRLRPGVWFMVGFLSRNCSVRMLAPATSPSETKPKNSASEGYPLSPLVKVQDIYTLFYQDQEKGFIFAGEQHEPFELVYVDKGRLHSVAGGQDYLLEAGEMMIYAPNQWHVQYADEGSAVGFIIVSFDMECPYIQLLTNHRIAAGGAVRELLFGMLEEQERDDFLYVDVVHNMLKNLLLVVLRQEQQAAQPLAGHVVRAKRENEIVEAAQRFITGNLEQRLTVEAIARGVNVSPSYLTALFRKHVGMSPGRYFNRVKLAESKRLIRDKSDNLTEISRFLGYATLQHFSRSFKAEFHMTPSEYARASR